MAAVNMFPLLTICPPTDFTISIWFKTNTITGGKLIGFRKCANRIKLATYDRHIYMNNAGQIYFGVYPNTVVTS